MSDQTKPVLTANSVAGAVHAVVLVLGWLGLDDAKNLVSTQTSVIVSIALAVFAFGTNVLAALHAQSKVTPVDSPRNNAGVPLVPINEQPLIPSVTSTTPTINSGVGGAGSTYISFNSRPQPGLPADVLPDADAVLAEAQAIHPV